jgi:hypothetical protein
MNFMITETTLNATKNLLKDGVEINNILNLLLKDIPSEMLLNIVNSRSDMSIIGDWFCKQQIMELCEATAEEVDCFLDDEGGLHENDAIREQATFDLREAFDGWKEEHYTTLND